MELPRFRKSVKIKFWSLRMGIARGGGVEYDNDEQVIREAYRVKTEDSWRWQIKGFNKLPGYDVYADTDQECLNELGSGKGFEII